MPAAHVNQFERAFRAWPLLTATAKGSAITYSELADYLHVHPRPLNAGTAGGACGRPRSARARVDWRGWWRASPGSVAAGWRTGRPIWAGCQRVSPCCMEQFGVSLRLLSPGTRDCVVPGQERSLRAG